MCEHPIKKWLLDTLFALTHPRHWFRNYPTSKELDAWFNEKMQEGQRFYKVRRHTAHYDGTEIWIANHPYASFSLCEHPGVLPKRRTVAKLKKLLVLSFLEEDEMSDGCILQRVLQASSSKNDIQ
jgi:hypothetical protein